VAALHRALRRQRRGRIGTVGCDRLLQCRLIPLAGQHGVRLALDDRLGSGGLAVQRMWVTTQPSNARACSSLGTAAISWEAAGTASCPSTR